MSVRTWTLLVAASTVALSGHTAVPAQTRVQTASTVAGPASVTWGPVKRLAPNPHGESLAVDASNRVTVVWANARAPHGIVVQQRRAGGTWGTRVVVGHGYDPVVGTDGRGNVVVAWITARPGYTTGVAAATRRGGHWSHPVRLTSDVPLSTGPSSSGVGHLSIAVSPRGATVVAWDRGRDGRPHSWRIMSAYRAPGRAFGPTVRVTPADGSSWPQVGIGSRGNAILVFERWLSGATQALFSSRRIVGHGWTGSVRVVHEGFGESLAVDAQGRAVVVYSPNFNRVMAVRSAARGTWSVPRALSPAGVRIDSYSLSMNAPGTAIVALGRPGGRIDVVRRPASGPWSAPVIVTRGEEPPALVLTAINAAGDTFAGWGEYALLGAYRPHTAGWGSPTVVSPDAGVEVLETMHAIVAPRGDVTVLWKQEDLPLKVRTMTVSTAP